jgi:hypothetical protein
MPKLLDASEEAQKEMVKNITGAFFKVSLGIAAFFSAYAFYNMNNRIDKIGNDMVIGQDKINEKLESVQLDLRRMEVKIVRMEVIQEKQ